MNKNLTNFYVASSHNFGNWLSWVLQKKTLKNLLICWCFYLLRILKWISKVDCLIDREVLSVGWIPTYWELMLSAEKRKWRMRRWNALDLYITHLFNIIFSALNIICREEKLFSSWSIQQQFIRRDVFILRGGAAKKAERSDITNRTVKNISVKFGFFCLWKCL